MARIQMDDHCFGIASVASVKGRSPFFKAPVLINKRGGDYAMKMETELILFRDRVELPVRFCAANPLKVVAPSNRIVRY
ncbi:MAG: hypothetical protein ACREQC_01560, partial [Candidatus Binataceae bacterium]